MGSAAASPADAAAAAAFSAFFCPAFSLSYAAFCTDADCSYRARSASPSAAYAASSAASDRSTGAGDGAAATASGAASPGGAGVRTISRRAIHLHRRRRRRAGARVAVGRRLRKGLAVLRHALAAESSFSPAGPMYSAYLRPLGSATRCSRRHPGGSAAVPFGDLPGDLPPPCAAAAAARDRISIAKSWSAVGGGLSGGATPAAAHSRAYRSLSCSAAATYSARSSAPMPFHRSASSFVTSAAFASGFAAATSGRVLSPKKMKAVRGFFGPLGAFASSVAGAAAAFAAAFAASAAAFASAFSARAASRSAFAASFSALAFSRACRGRVAPSENCAP